MTPGSCGAIREEPAGIFPAIILSEAFSQATCSNNFKCGERGREIAARAREIAVILSPKLDATFAIRFGRPTAARRMNLWA